MNFKKSGHFFSENRAPGTFGAPDCHPSTLIDLAKIDMASKGSVETVCMICESYRTHRGFTGPMNFKKVRTFFSENRAPGILGPLAAIQTLYLTFQTLLRPIKVP